MFAQEILPSIHCQSPHFWVNQMLDLAMLMYTIICRIPKFSVRISSALFLMITGIKIIWSDKKEWQIGGNFFCNFAGKFRSLLFIRLKSLPESPCKLSVTFLLSFWAPILLWIGNVFLLMFNFINNVYSYWARTGFHFTDWGDLKYTVLGQ